MGRADRVAYTAVLVAAGLTYAITWPLWSDRSLPPNLPLLPIAVPGASVGLLLVGALVLAIFRPALGSMVHAALVVGAVVTDQLRLQPEIVSMALLLVAFSVPGWIWLGRAHLIALWGYAAVWKAASPSFRLFAAPQLVRDVWESAPGVVTSSAWLGVVGLEAAAALLAIFRRTRRAAVIVAVVLHASILVDLAIVQDVNRAVWPWQVALIAAAIGLLWQWRESIVDSVASMRPGVASGVVAIAVMPALWLAGVTDAALAHHLYSGAVASAQTCKDVTSAQTSCLPISVELATLEVPMPPEPRVFRAYFAATCQAGDLLVIDDPRGWLASGDSRMTAFMCRPP